MATAADKTRKAGKRAYRRQYAALPWRRGANGLEVLLVTSRETRRWVIPKGWPMRHKTSSETAAQETWEEAGVTGEVAPDPVGEFLYMKRMAKGRLQLCAVEVFALRVTEELEDWPEKDQRERRWMTPADAASSVDEADLADLIAAFADRAQ